MLLGLLTSEQILIRTVSVIAWRLDFDWNMKPWRNKAFAKDLKTIYTAANEETARKQLEAVTGKWSAQYPSAMNRWHDNWDAVSPIFKFSKEVRTAFYTTNAIESLNSCYRRLNKQRSVFPSSQALMKALYLGTFEIAQKWTMPIRNWGKVRGELEIMYPERMSI